MANPKFTEKDMKELLRTAEATLAAAVANSYLKLTVKLPLKKLEKLIRTGKWEDAIDEIDSAFDDIPKAYKKEYTRAGRRASKFLKDGANIIVNFDAKNFRAENAIKANELRLIQQFTQSQKVITRNAVFRGIREGLNPLETARMFRDSIGLTTYQSNVVNSYRKKLENLDTSILYRDNGKGNEKGYRLRDKRFDSPFLNAVRENKPLTPEQIDRFTDRYRERWIKFRSEVISRTESLRAVHEGKYEMWAQIIEENQLPAELLIETWNTSVDGRERKTHGAMHGQQKKVGVEEFFVSPSGAMLKYPCDVNAPAAEVINCRCFTTTEILMDQI